MEQEQRWAELKAQISKGRQRRGGKVDTEVHQAVVGEVQGGLAEGHYLVEMSEWLGVHHATLGRWLREAAAVSATEGKFAKVQIREEVQAEREGHFISKLTEVGVTRLVKKPKEFQRKTCWVSLILLTFHLKRVTPTRLNLRKLLI